MSSTYEHVDRDDDVQRHAAVLARRAAQQRARELLDRGLHARALANRRGAAGHVTSCRPITAHLAAVAGGQEVHAPGHHLHLGLLLGLLVPGLHVPCLGLLGDGEQPPDRPRPGPRPLAAAGEEEGGEAPEAEQHQQEAAPGDGVDLAAGDSSRYIYTTNIYSLCVVCF